MHHVRKTIFVASPGVFSRARLLVYTFASTDEERSSTPSPSPNPRMIAVIRRPGKCAFCTFRTTQWSITPSRWQNGTKRHRSKTATANKYTAPQGRAGPGGHSRPSYYNGKDTGPRAAEGQQSASGGNSYDVFAGLVDEQMGKNRRTQLQLLDARVEAQKLSRSEAEPAFKKLRQQLGKFSDSVSAAADDARSQQLVTKSDNPLFFYFRQAFIKGHIGGLFEEIKYRFKVFTLEAAKHSVAFDTLRFQKAVADLTHPMEWYPATRAMQREVHLHIGPTNSGKTYHALQRLEKAKSGIFAGPLRLLAHEVYTRFNAKGIKCALITGEEQRIPENMTAMMNSCTVEMVPLNTVVDVCVIDEIQMIGDVDRGWAWTSALLGVQAKELHLCGEVRTEQLVRSMCEAMGEKLIVHRYERLGLLETQTKHLDPNNLKGVLEKGDAVIMFSRLQIHQMKKDIEKATGRRCAVVYGSLPPETRAAQAALFNDQSNDYDFLVASNAVGMGLNLSIKRIIFEATVKSNGQSVNRLETSEIKQIAGRAGRYKSAHAAIQEANIDNSNSAVAAGGPTLTSAAAIGYVNAFHRDDLNIIKTAMKTDVEPMESAGILPPGDVLTRFAAFFSPDTDFSYILLRLKELTQLHPSYHICNFQEQVELLDLIQPYDLTLADRITFMAAPVNLREKEFAAIVVDFAKALVMRDGRDLLDFESIPLYLLEKDIHDHPSGAKGYLRQAEMLHRGLATYLWLSYRFAGTYRLQALCFHIKSLVEQKIDECLAEVTVSPSKVVRAQRQFERQEELERMMNEWKKGMVNEPEATVVEESIVVEELLEDNEEDADFLDEEERKLAPGVDVFAADDSPADASIPQTPKTPSTNFIPGLEQSSDSTQPAVRG
jgi:ATP-dependent RNA helicase SUPV3L1/SUV3